MKQLTVKECYEINQIPELIELCKTVLKVKHIGLGVSDCQDLLMASNHMIKKTCGVDLELYKEGE